MVKFTLKIENSKKALKEQWGAGSPGDTEIYVVTVIKSMIIPNGILLLFSHLIVSNSLQPRGLQYTSLQWNITQP